VSARVAAGTVGDALGAATDALAAAGADAPRLDADLLLAAASGIDRARLEADPDAGVAPEAARRFGAMMRRRVAREPVAYILGRRAFRHIEVVVDRRVLIPRPETELLVEVALELSPRSVLDVGTGSGAIALALAGELPDASIVATDTDSRALDLARANAERLGLAARVRFERGTLPGGERFDLVLANLPYVADGEWEGLAPEITRYEPRDALVAGPTGLEAIIALLDVVGAAGGPAGVAAALAVEVGAGQAPAVADLVRRAGYGSVTLRADLAGIDRMVIGR
jgi:release factor glutamine methyltransferase